MVLDRLVHQGLGEGRLQRLVVAEAAVAHHVDHDILVEQLAEFGRDAGAMHHRFGIVAIHMEDRRLHHQRDVGAIGRGTRIGRRGRKADLVVDDEMDGAAGAETLGAAHREAFGDHALAGERRVAVQQQRHHRGTLRDVFELLLLGARLAEHDGIGGFQMRRVRRQREMDFVIVEFAVGRGAQMILHVARTLHLGRIGAAAGEFVEKLAIGLAHHVGEHVEAAAMRHADDDFFDAERAAALDDLLQRRDHRLAAVEPEALGAEESQAREFLETFGLDQLVQDRLLALGREHDLLVGAFDAALQPVLLLGIVDVHELIADAAAIGALQDLDDPARRRGLQPQHAAQEDRTVEVFGMEAVEIGIELGMRLLGRDLQGIEVGLEMTDDTVGAHDLNGADGILRHLVQVGGAGLAFARRPLPGQGADQIAIRQLRLLVAPPGGPAAKLRRRKRVLAQAQKIGTPAFVHRIGIFQVLGVERLDEGGVGAGEKRGRFEQLIGAARETIGL